MSIDVVIRAHDPGRLDELARAVFSAAVQEHRPTSITLVCQRFSPGELDAVRRTTAPLLELAGDVPLSLLNRPDPTPADARAALLNIGLRAGAAAYVAILDYDDVIYPEAYRLLTDELATSGAAVAFGAVLNASVSREGIVPYVTAKRRVFQGDGLPQLLRSNFCPIHSFVLDRRRIDPDDLQADEGLVALEDYDLLLRIVSKYPSSFHHKDTVVGEYLLKDDHSNLNPMAETSLGGDTWLAALDEVNRRKDQLTLSPAVQAQLGIDEPGLTVAAYLDR